LCGRRILSLKSEEKWMRICNFGRHSHIIKEDKTLCGKDISLFNWFKQQKNPPKKCNRCLKIYEMLEFERKIQLEIPA